MEKLQYSTLQQNTEINKKASFSDNSQDDDHHKSIWIKRKAPAAHIPVTFSLWEGCVKNPTKQQISSSKIEWDDCLKLNQHLRNIGSFTEGVNVKRRNGPNDFFFSKIGRNSKMIAQRENSCKTNKFLDDLSSSSLDTINEKDQNDKIEKAKKRLLKSSSTFYKHKARKSNISVLKDKIWPINLRLLQNLRENITKVRKIVWLISYRSTNLRWTAKRIYERCRSLIIQRQISLTDQSLDPI